MINVTGCQAKVPATCPYHGAALRVEAARESGDMELWFTAVKDLEKAERSLKLRQRFNPFLKETLDNVVPAEKQKAPVNHQRYTGSVEVHPYEGEKGFYGKKIVYAATREEVYDKLVHASKAIVDEIKKNNPDLTEEDLNAKLYSESSFPPFAREEDTGNNGSGGPTTLNDLVRDAAHNREMNIRYYNTSEMSRLTGRREWTDEMREQYNGIKINDSLFEMTEEELLDDKYSAVGRVFK